jgi:hypothetical protein
MNEPVLPSRRQLFKTTLIAAAVAGAIVATVVLPAEYGIDPTRIGGLLGLTAMGTAKGAASAVNADASAAPASGDTEDASVMQGHKSKWSSGRVEIEVAGREELEYKAALAKGEPLLYEWTVSGGPLYFEFHGEPTEGEWPEGFYQSYRIGESSEAEAGSFVAPFTGNHGWYWRNDSDDTVTVTLQAAGYYTSLGRVGGSSAPAE